MLTLTEIGTVFALVGGTVFYVLLMFFAKREKAAGNRDLQRQVEAQAAQLQAIEARLRYVEAALCGGGGPALASLTSGTNGSADGERR